MFSAFKISNVSAVYRRLSLFYREALHVIKSLTLAKIIHEENDALKKLAHIPISMVLYTETKKIEERETQKKLLTAPTSAISFLWASSFPVALPSIHC